MPRNCDLSKNPGKKLNGKSSQVTTPHINTANPKKRAGGWVLGGRGWTPNPNAKKDSKERYRLPRNSSNAHENKV